MRSGPGGLDDVGGRGFASRYEAGRRSGRHGLPRRGGVSVLLIVTSSVTLATPAARRFHVIERVDYDAVVGAVAGGLDDDESPEAHCIDENFFLFLPRGSEELYWDFDDRGNRSKGPMTCI